MDKMRLIHLMVAEFQTNNKWVARKVLAQAEKAAAVAPEQYGLRKLHQAIHACLNKVLTADLSYLRRLPIVIASNDAKGCYDRIHLSVAILTLYSFGVPYKICKVLFTVLRRAIHSIQTGHGTVHDAYGGEGDNSNDAGQGNGMGPALWALILTKIIEAMRRAGHGITFVTALTKNIIAFVGFAFVDNTDLGISADSPSVSGEELIASAQAAMNLWSQLLVATGRALEPAKSFCYLLDYEFHPASCAYRYRSKDDLPGEFSLLDHTGASHGINMIEPQITKKTLGVFIAMDGNQEAQKEYLTNLSLE